MQIISDTGFISKIHKESIQLNSTKTIQLQSGQRMYIDIFPKKMHKWPTGTWKLLNITL